MRFPVTGQTQPCGTFAAAMDIGVLVKLLRKQVDLGEVGADDEKAGFPPVVARAKPGADVKRSRQAAQGVKQVVLRSMVLQARVRLRMRIPGRDECPASAACQC